VAPALRERYFGRNLELHSHDNYCPAWDNDLLDPSSVPGGDGESVAAVAARLQELLQVAAVKRVEGVLGQTV
jgi:hypothetical protein